MRRPERTTHRSFAPRSPMFRLVVMHAVFSIALVTASADAQVSIYELGPEHRAASARVVTSTWVPEKPMVATMVSGTPHNSLVVWTGYAPYGTTDDTNVIFGSLVDAAGNPLQPAAFRIAKNHGQSGEFTNHAIAGSDSNYLVVNGYYGGLKANVLTPSG